MASKKPFSLSMKVVIKDGNDRVLLLKRSMNSKGNPGKLDFPGGKMDPGESFDQALLREVAEETGLAISITGVAGATESETSDRRVAYLIMEASAESGEVKLSDEHDGYVWAPLSEFPKMDLAPQFRDFARRYGEAG